jgi:Zn finger protein HypA/HybF involved in hydrogenase expression
MMALTIKDDFYKCPNCDHAYFEIKKYHVIKMDGAGLLESEGIPTVGDTKIKFKCENCKKLSTKEEMIDYAK